MIQLRKSAIATSSSSVPNGESSAESSSSSDGNKGCSHAELLSYAKKLHMEEEGIKVDNKSLLEFLLIYRISPLGFEAEWNRNEQECFLSKFDSK